MWKSKSITLRVIKIHKKAYQLIENFLEIAENFSGFQLGIQFFAANSSFFDRFDKLGLWKRSPLFQVSTCAQKKAQLDRTMVNFGKTFTIYNKKTRFAGFSLLAQGR